MNCEPESARPFPEDEYLARETRVRAIMRERGFDVLYITSPANLVYLTGYEASWYPPRLPLGCALVLDPPELLFFDWTRHAPYAELHARHTELVLFDYSDAVDVLAGALQARGLASRTIAMEWSSYTPAAPVTTAIVSALRSRGATVVSADWLVDGVRLVKSDAEITRVRRAAAHVDAAFAALAEELRPGLTEAQVSAMVGGLLADAGSGQAAQAAFVSSGPTAWLDTHAFPSQRRLGPGDIVTVDACGAVDRYHANLSRTFSLGPADELAVALLAEAGGGLLELRRRAQLNEPTAIAMGEAEQWVRARVPETRIWWVGGYSLGIALPPSWVGHMYLAGDGPEQVRWTAGYVSNYETVLYDKDSGIAVEAIDTLLMTEQGLEVLSELPREIIEIPIERVRRRLSRRTTGASYSSRTRK